MIWLGIAAVGIALVLVVAVTGSGWAGRVLYSWRHARHLAEVTQTEPEPAPEYGSMSLADERRYYSAEPARIPIYKPRDPYGMHPDWREQTAADLSPEALDPGAGEGESSSPPPAPDPDPGRGHGDLSQTIPPSARPDWLPVQMAGLYSWVRKMHGEVTG